MKKEVFKKCMFISLLIFLIMCVISIMIKYDVEGEKELPFSIDKILLVSTVDGIEQDDPTNFWNIAVTQVNDAYIYINKTENNETTIKEVRLENFNLVQVPQKGSVHILKPTGELQNLYTYSEHDYFNESITYLGATIDNMKATEIANTGGMLGFRTSLGNLGNFISNEEIEVTYDGRLLSNLNVKLEELKFTLGFDIVIVTSDDISYKGTINLEMPVDNVIEQGSSSVELTDFSNVVFKRI